MKLFCLWLLGPLSALAAPGGLDLSFNPRFNGWVNTLALQPDQQIVVGGQFTEVDGVPRRYLARLHPDGSLDTSFDPRPDGGGASPYASKIRNIVFEADGGIVIAGVFTTVSSVSRSGIARLSGEGVLDPSFNPSIGHGTNAVEVTQVVVQKDGKLLICGWFDQVSGVRRESFARLNRDGTLDSSFAPFTDISGERITEYGMAVQQDDKILAYGRLSQSQDNYRHFFVRLFPDGQIDPEFNLVTNAEVELLVLARDGRIYIGGDFTTVHGVLRRGLARLHANGSLDTTFVPSGDFEHTRALLPLRDGSLLVGGDYVAEDRIGLEPGSIPAEPAFEGGLVLLQSNGSRQSNFAAKVTVTEDVTPIGVTDLVLQNNGNILLCGFVTAVNGMGRTNLARLIGPPQPEVTLCCAGFLDGAPSFMVDGLPDRAIQVEASTNFVDWTLLETISIGSQPRRFNDLSIGLSTLRFYRASAHP